MAVCRTPANDGVTESVVLYGLNPAAETVTVWVPSGTFARTAMPEELVVAEMPATVTVAPAIGVPLAARTLKGIVTAVTGVTVSPL